MATCTPAMMAPAGRPVPPRTGTLPGRPLLPRSMVSGLLQQCFRGSFTPAQTRWADSLQLVSDLGKIPLHTQSSHLCRQRPACRAPHPCHPIWPCPQGATWKPQPGSGSRSWGPLASSSDGMRLAAVDSTSGLVLVSSDAVSGFSEGLHWLIAHLLLAGRCARKACEKMVVWSGSYSEYCRFEVVAQLCPVIHRHRSCKGLPAATLCGGILQTSA